jgi:hypothetical protein
VWDTALTQGKEESVENKQRPERLERTKNGVVVEPGENMSRNREWMDNSVRCKGEKLLWGSAKAESIVSSGNAVSLV